MDGWMDGGLRTTNAPLALAVDRVAQVLSAQRRVGARLDADHAYVDLPPFGPHG
jgi:hypothetical protein